jgi:hypothetical protein
MKIFAHENSAHRVEPALAAHELILVDGKGVCRAGGKIVEATAMRPDIAWLTFDALSG